MSDLVARLRVNGTSLYDQAADEIERLDAELKEYELAYQMTTPEFLLRVADPRDDLSDVEDATFWKATYEIAEKIRIEARRAR